MSNSELHMPLKMHPILFEKVWGGSRLCDVAGKKSAHLDAAKVGESWEVADLKEGCSVVDGGPFDGISLRDLATEYGRHFVGDVDKNDAGEFRFPLLVKLIDTSADLSVQVHPSKDNAHLFENAASKDECWWVLDADKGAKLASGMISDATAGDVTRDDLKKALDDKTPEKLLRFVDVKAGDALHIQPGTVHAIGAGVFLLEVQEPSDTTFRVWDYERPGLDGKPRKLHVEQALQVMHFGEQPPALTELVSLGEPGKCEQFLVVDTASYRLERLCFNKAALATFAKRTNTPWVVSSTNAAIDVAAGTYRVHLEPYSTCIVPALVDQVVLFSMGAGDVLISGLSGAQLVTKPSLIITKSST
ncbi:MAG: hypothetical protein GY822_24325 [Deltaproteobacteria bacterium]|nr:hypothetical protein [Deltaproteobacteria bacterium]